MFMEFTNRFEGTLRYVQSRWPTYFFGYCGGVILAVSIVLVSAFQGWFSFVILGFVALLILAYFLIASLWAAHQLYDGQRIGDTLFRLGGLKSQDTLVHITLGRRGVALDLSRQLTTGQVIVIDVYNPQMAPNRELARARRQAIRPDPDPRLSWRDGYISLLPLPDSSVAAVTLSEVASELWQGGDQLQLLSEVHRILIPGGCILLAERVRSTANIAVMGPAGLRLRSFAYWKKLLTNAGFDFQDWANLNDLICGLRACKPAPDRERQLSLDI
jgi:SAM-dependent methyltransferase